MNRFSSLSLVRLFVFLIGSIFFLGCADTALTEQVGASNLSLIQQTESQNAEPTLQADEQDKDPKAHRDTHPGTEDETVSLLISLSSSSSSAYKLIMRYKLIERNPVHTPEGLVIEIGKANLAQFLATLEQDADVAWVKILNAEGQFVQ